MRGVEKPESAAFFLSTTYKYWNETVSKFETLAVDSSQPLITL